jgi:hypothetical protein
MNFQDDSAKHLTCLSLQRVKPLRSNYGEIELRRDLIRLKPFPLDLDRAELRVYVGWVALRLTQPTWKPL